MIDFDRALLNKLYQYSFALTNKESDAYDLLHSGLEKYLRANTGEIRNKEAYLKRIIKNTYIDEYRKKIKIEEEEYNDTVTYVDINLSTLEEMVASQLQIEQIWQYLTSVEREIMYLWAVDGYSISELSEYLDIPKGTLLSKIHRMRIRLEKSFKEFSKGEAL